ncbi:DUF2147 domain-containing protein [Paracoccus sp. (in: a-proteobacteria)]|uniref:DUF2147 domain-containing protein n=1 Tax=Paracoccus sp. TaxID=267 RepID=UPI0026DF02CC|nr:DUF2147 domain-containing protein [Paracoccus sp. (in: a-proteobacteria)]MDO5648040.1 DUF2147 domain-containing protein [Paracoccus sp. (in: a-proteobacteria)]
MRFLLACVAMLWAGIAAADPIAGVWQTAPEADGGFAHVTIAPCGAAFCGTITRTYVDGKNTPTEYVGARVVMDMVPQAGGDYRGRLLRPTNNRQYTGKASVQGDRLRVSGCVAGGLICDGETWVRVR